MEIKGPESLFGKDWWEKHVSRPTALQDFSYEVQKLLLLDPKSEAWKEQVEITKSSYETVMKIATEKQKEELQQIRADIETLKKSHPEDPALILKIEDALDRLFLI